jgi:hypothetical protein
MSASLALGLIATYVAAPIALYLAVLRWLGSRRDLRVLALCFGLAPPLISRVLTWAMYALPGRPDGTYIAIVLSAFFLLFVYGRRVEGLGGVCRVVTSWFRQSLHAMLLAAVVTAAVTAGLFSQPVAELASRYYLVLLGAEANPAGWGFMPRYACATLVLLGICSIWVLLVPGQRPTHVSTRSITVGALTGLVLSTLVAAAILQLGRPVYESDALNYFNIATVLYEKKSLSSYPLLLPEPDGMYDPSAHPLGYLGTLVWSFMLAGAPVPGAAKLSILIATAATLVGLWSAMWRLGAIVVLAGMLVLITTPGYVAQVLGAGADAHRLALLLFTVVTLVLATEYHGKRAWVVSGAAAGLALSSHSEMALLVPIAIVATVGVLSNAPLWERAKMITLVASVAFIVGGERYALNFFQFGTPLYNDAPLFELVPELDYHGWRFGLAPRQDFWGRLSFGGLMGFTHWYFFGISWWLALFAMAINHKVILNSAELRAFLMTIFFSTTLLIGFFAFTRAGELLIGNYRYVLALQPMVAALAGVLIGATYDKCAFAR